MLSPRNKTRMLMGILALYVFLRGFLLAGAILFSSLVLGIVGYIVYSYVLRSFLLPWIPELKPNSFLFGYTIPFIPLASDGKAHQILLEEAEKYGKNPGCAQFVFVNRNVVMVFDGKIAKAVLKNVPKANLGDPTIIARNKSTFNAVGVDWELRRRAFRPAFSVSGLRQHESIIRAIVGQVSEIFHKAAVNNEIVEVDKLCGKMTVDVICSVAFQYPINALGDSPKFQLLHDSLRQMFQNIWVTLLPFASQLLLLPLPYFSQYATSAQILREFSIELLTHMRRLDEKGELKEGGLARALLDWSKATGAHEEDILAEIRLQFIAGHETTAHTLSFIIYSLARYPHIQRKAQQAVDEALVAKENVVGAGVPDANEDAEARALSSSLLPPYLEAVVKESMRRFPTAAMGSLRRVEAKEGFTITLREDGKSDSDATDTTDTQKSGGGGAGERRDTSTSTGTSTSIRLQQKEKPPPTLRRRFTRRGRGRRKGEERDTDGDDEEGVEVEVEGEAEGEVEFEGGAEGEWEGEEVKEEVKEEKEGKRGGEEATKKQQQSNEVSTSSPARTVVLKRGTFIMVPIYPLQNCSANWENPLSFDPERWLPKASSPPRSATTSTSTSATSPPSSTSSFTSLSSPGAFSGTGTSPDSLGFAPFSYGSRNCLGMNLALLEIRLGVMEWIGKFNFKLVGVEEMKEDAPPEEMLETFITMRPKRHMPILVSLRK